MRVLKIQSSELTGAVQEYLESNEHYKHISTVISIFNRYPIILVGGFVRDPIVKSMHKNNGKTRDCDILIDDSNKKVDIRKEMNGLNLVNTRYGTPKWKPIDGFEIDITLLSEFNRQVNDGNTPALLEARLQGCDLTTSAIAYNLQEKTIYSCKAIEGIISRKVDILCTEGKTPPELMCRCVLHTHKLEFGRGQKATQFIKENYNLGVDKEIKNYMEEKGTLSEYIFVINQLKDISQS